MKNERNIFSEDIEIPDIVMQEADAAFNLIKSEDEKTMIRNEKDINDGNIDGRNADKISISERNINGRNRRRFFKTQAAAIACICILSVGAISVAAAIHHYWGRGMQGTLQATDEQRNTLSEQGVAAVLSEDENYEDMAVTSGNITITPDTVISDGKCAYVSFSVKGYSVDDNEEPGFETVNVYMGDDPNGEINPINMGASFYNGIVSDETGGPIYDDGSAIEFTEDGDLESHYYNEEGNLEYVVSVMVGEPDNSLLGKTLHVELENLGTLYKADYSGETIGNWDFAIPLPEVSAATDFRIGKEVPGTVFEVDSIALSPVSIKVDYSVNGKVEMYQDENMVPMFNGVVLKDGTRLPYFGNGGYTGYSDEKMTSAYSLSAFDRVIDVNQVKSLIVRTGEEQVEIPLE